MLTLMTRIVTQGSGWRDLTASLCKIEVTQTKDLTVMSLKKAMNLVYSIFEFDGIAAAIVIGHGPFRRQIEFSRPGWAVASGRYLFTLGKKNQ